MAMPALPPFLNERLLYEPMNWLVIGTIATIWLLAFHVIMKAFGAMKSTGSDAGQAPGQAPVAGPAPGPDGYAGSFPT
jgi:hypothetical protein